MHDGILAGHLGKKKTKKRLLQKFYWFEVDSDVNNWVVGCDVCARTKKAVKTPRAPLGSMRTGAPMERLGIDILGPFPTTERLNRYILTVICHFTKWVEIFPIQNESAESCARVLVNEVISRYGCPIEIHTDQGRNFQS